MTRDKAIELLARALYDQGAKAVFGHYDKCHTSIRGPFRAKATALLDQIAPLTAQAVEAERAACTEELRLAVAAARADERERCAKVAEAEGVYPALNVYDGGPDWYKHGKRIAAAIRNLEWDHAAK